MKIIQLIRNFISDTYGQFALAMFLVCVLSGVFLAIPYDPSRAYESVSWMMVFNPYALLFRNMHYWSAQLFLIFTLLHFWDHFIKKPTDKVKKAVWFRLSLSLFITFFVMLSGFIVKGDADSRQAWQILNTLLSSIPGIGSFLAISLMGKAGNYQLLYTHHIATATIILVLLIFEHARTVWGKPRTFFLSLVLILILSMFINAPLHDNNNPVMKGPWYFVGLQEILHALKHPAWILVVFVVYFLLIYFLPQWKQTYHQWGKRILWISFIFYGILTISGFYFRGENWSRIYPWQKNYLLKVYLPEISFPVFNTYREKAENYELVKERVEGCMVCHENVQGFSASHNPLQNGCVSCHYGNPFTLNKKLAHKGMFSIPGQMENADLSCGNSGCHENIIERVNLSLMNTMSGVVSVDKWVFNVYHHPDSLSDIKKIAYDKTDMHLRTLCASCHLGKSKNKFAPIDQKSRGGGCLACHLNYSDSALKELMMYQKSGVLPELHPSVDIHVTDEHCFGCHSRSGRISLSYAGWHESGFKEKNKVADEDSLMTLKDGRILVYRGEDVHHRAGMECIDCHISYELMGDGKSHAHKEDALKIECLDCHRKKYQQVGPESLKTEEALIMGLRNYPFKPQKFVTSGKSQYALTNTHLRNDSLFVISKNTGKVYYSPPAADVCVGNKSHQQMACTSCHTQWSAQCFDCHTSWERNKKGYDLLTNQVVKGKWAEKHGKFQSGQPVLGVSIRENNYRIIPVMPGMVFTFDNGDSVTFKRLFAPASPHTISKKIPACQDCHFKPFTLGLGTGNFKYEKDKNILRYVPASRLLEDGLPYDAWTAFLSNEQKNKATRLWLRPFNAAEQRKIITVGLCLDCHQEDKNFEKSLLENYEVMKKNMKPLCIIPEFKP